MKTQWLLCLVLLFGTNQVSAGDYDVFIHPVSSRISTGCDFGNNPCASDNSYHVGIDYTSSDRSVIAVNHGRVAQIVENGKNDHGLGNTVILEHWLVNGGVAYSCYSHLESIDILVYEKRSKYGTIQQWLSLGDPIGKMGGSGFGDSGYWDVHLHFEFKTQGVLGSPSGSYYGYTPNFPAEFGYLNFHDYVGKVYVGDPYLPGDGSGYNGDSGDPGYYSGGQGGGTNPSPSNSKPDFYVVSVKIADDSDGDHPKEAYYPNEKFYVIAAIGNAGIEPTKDIKVGYYLYQGDDREKVGEEDIKHEHLPKGGTHTERAELEDIDPGTYQVKVRPDNEKEISESDEDNNWSVPVTLVVREWPNFVVDGIVFDEGTSFMAGNAVSLRAKFYNRGGDTKDGIAVACYLVSGGVETLVATQTIKDYHLEENEYHWEGMSFVLPSVPGNYSFKVVADPGGLVKESNEGDNQMVIPLTVVAPATTTTTTTSTTTTSTTTTTTTTAVTTTAATTSTTSTSTTTTTTFASTTSTTTNADAEVGDIHSLPYSEDFENGPGDFILEDAFPPQGAVLVVLESEGENGSDCLAIVNQESPGDSWDVRAKIVGFDFKEGASYRLALSLKSEVSGNFSIEFSSAISPDEVFFYDEMEILPGWGNYSWGFLASDLLGINPADIQLAIEVGESPGTYQIDNVSLVMTNPPPNIVPVPAPAIVPANSFGTSSVQNTQNGSKNSESGGGGCFISLLF